MTQETTLWDFRTRQGCLFGILTRVYKWENIVIKKCLNKIYVRSNDAKVATLRDFWTPRGCLFDVLLAFINGVI